MKGVMAISPGEDFSVSKVDQRSKVSTNHRQKVLFIFLLLLYCKELRSCKIGREARSKLEFTPLLFEVTETRQAVFFIFIKMF